MCFGISFSSTLTTRHVKEIGRQLVTVSLTPLLNTGVIFANLHSLGSLPNFREKLNIFEKDGAIDDADSLSIHAVIPSGPQALLVFKPNSNFSTSSSMASSGDLLLNEKQKNLLFR